MNIVDALLNIALVGSAWVLYLLLFLSVMSFGVMFERAWFFYKNSRGGGESLRAGLLAAIRGNDAEQAERVLRGSKTIEGEIVATALVFREGGASAFKDALDAEIVNARPRLEAGMNFLGTVGNNAPFIGLFGTVIGVIVAFHELGKAGAQAGGMGNVMSGIAEALVATGVGIFVALPGVVAYNMSQKRIGEIEGTANSLGHLVAAWLETRHQGGEVLSPNAATSRAQPTAPGATTATALSAEPGN